MIYRIDMQHFLNHALDHFSLQDITTFQYCIISAKIMNNGMARNVVKMNDLYPDYNTVMTYVDTKDKSILEKMYRSMLKPEKKFMKNESTTFESLIYQTFINPLLQRFNIMILCDKEENDYIDILCKFLKDEYNIEVIDLNELFTKGRVGPIYIDRDEIRDKAVDIRRAALRDQVRALSSTRDGKESLITKMTKKKKLKELDRYGIDGSDMKESEINAALLEEWCREDGQWDGD